MYDIVFSSTARKQLRSLEKNTQEHIIKVLERVRFRPEKFVKRLVGDLGYRLRVGDYRIIMDIDRGNLIILVIKIGHRKNIYKK